jgi:hypothetical protein
LHSGEYSGHEVASPVRIALPDSAALNSLRPPLGHLVYVAHGAAEGHSYSVVQFFGGIQLYCDLGTAMELQNFLIVGTHDPITHREDFRVVDRVNYPLPPQFLTPDEWREGVRARFEAMRLELVALYGDQAPLSLTLNN